MSVSEPKKRTSKKSKPLVSLQEILQEPLPQQEEPLPHQEEEKKYNIPDGINPFIDEELLNHKREMLKIKVPLIANELTLIKQSISNLKKNIVELEKMAKRFLP
jgi:hypothetical protein